MFLPKTSLALGSLGHVRIATVSFPESIEPNENHCFSRICQTKSRSNAFVYSFPLNTFAQVQIVLPGMNFHKSRDGLKIHLK